MKNYTKNDIEKIAFKIGYFPQYSGKENKFFFQREKYTDREPTKEEKDFLLQFGDIV